MDNAHQSAAAKAKNPQALMNAIWPHRNIAEVKELLENGADPDGRVNGVTPILQAIMGGDRDQKTEIVKLLIEHGANLEMQREGLGWTPLMQAAVSRVPEVVALLLEQGVELHTESKNGKTALYLAQSRRHFEIADMLKAAMAGHVPAKPVKKTAEQIRQEAVRARQLGLQKKARKLILRRTI